MTNSYIQWFDTSWRCIALVKLHVNNSMYTLVSLSYFVLHNNGPTQSIPIILNGNF